MRSSSSVFPFPLRFLLFFIPMLIYSAAVRIRLSLYSIGLLRRKSLRSPVISIGNITAGGTGKTPLVALIARLLSQEGERVVVLSRGYRRQSRGAVRVSDGERLLVGWREAGDEPFLLAGNLKGVRVVVAEDRYAAARMVEEELGECVFLLDDGYQQIGLARNLNILLIDATDPFGGGWLLPLGRLREPLGEIKRADLVVITRADHPFDHDALNSRIRRYNRTVHFLYGYHDIAGFAPVEAACRVGRLPAFDREKLLPASAFTEKQVLAFAGIARPDIFFSDLKHFGIKLKDKLALPDHHSYTQSEIDEIAARARQLGAIAAITTEKDAVKLAELDLGRFPFYFAKLEAHVEDEGRLKFYLEAALGRFGR